MAVLLIVLFASLFVGGLVVGFIGCAAPSGTFIALGVIGILIGGVGMFWANGLYHDALDARCHDAGGTSVVEVGRGHLCVDDGGRIVAW